MLKAQGLIVLFLSGYCVAAMDCAKNDLEDQECLAAQSPMGVAQHAVASVYHFVHTLKNANTSEDMKPEMQMCIERLFEICVARQHCCDIYEAMVSSELLVNSVPGDVWEVIEKDERA